MAKDLGVAVVAENVTGAGGTLGAYRVAQARPDGHTLLMHHIGHATHATIYRRLPYDVEASFAPLGLVSDARDDADRAARTSPSTTSPG